MHRNRAEEPRSRGIPGVSVVTVRVERMSQPEIERPDRRRVVAEARRSSELEGARSTDASRADQDAYVRGEIDIDQLGERVRARYGLA